jgi:hypothetical protein
MKRFASVLLFGLIALPLAAQDRAGGLVLDPFGVNGAHASQGTDASTRRRSDLIVRLEFEPGVAEALGEGNDVTIDLWFFGEPLSDEIPIDDSGFVSLWSERLRVEPENQVIAPVHDSIELVLESSWDMVWEPYLNIAVSSDIHLQHDWSPFDCNLVRERVAVLRQRETVILCKLDEESPWRTTPKSRSP